MAVAVAFLGFAAIAAGLVALPQSDPMYGYNNSNCWDSDYTVKNDAGMPLFKYSFVNQAMKGTAYGIKTGSNEYIAGTDQCWNNKRLLEFFCDIKANKVTWNSYNCAAGTSCVDGACVSAGKPDLTVFNISVMPDDNNPGKKIVAVNVKNIGNAPALSFGVNLYQKNADGSSELLVWPEIAGVGDDVPKWGSTKVGPGEIATYAISELSLPATVTLASEVDPNNQVKESNEANNYLEKSFVEIGQLDLVVKSLSSNKLTNGNQDLGVVALSALNESITVNSIKFTIWLTNSTNSATSTTITTFSNLRLVDESGGEENVVAGPVELAAEPAKPGTYYAIFNNVGNIVLQAQDPKLADSQKKFVLKGSATGVSTGAYVAVKINPAKDVVGTGMDSGQKISPALDKLLAVSDKSY
ncbi:MAG: hypothetical protein A2921_00005 [Candidatus Magasanikbacteria bacterium RIFCSPLOWO2_01_FULL_43_20b]|uniref:CARDB domain-containing protein n=1 Tax=Candidatus Magasanikbacteria bacterium RIFCSPLOWO2_12_FULL_43_12 TaxID=1798692 RepID=A0A1F6MUA3_9BACT|nr:MAG: hypothetical protein A3C74_00885 [Candidatus Magasanikbacteria bacterium RIFCSPHIGHO2_02_FULL_44_13]OGH72949.1 MAG: hypothetical protein A2921_00005 [Candidatus Magasanikbacteria bacterium RIFCSPLOWO2_01_FULL_43_20b]OGH75003.1 MAG: hypothetical protein A3G00_01470 [Candidatus Magasanikbacteria bacterium RIFCSPLOWO2_12_FULL_43_12]